MQRVFYNAPATQVHGAYDTRTGEDAGVVEMPNRQTGAPMTYMIDGKQFIVLAVSGNDGAEILAYALP